MDATSGFTVADFTPDVIALHGPALLDIASDVPNEYWADEHFGADLPMKWVLSFVVCHEERPIAYAVLSRKGAGHCHLHHFMVHRAWRANGLGCSMMTEVARRALTAGLRRITLNVAADNQRARSFYSRLGFVSIESDRTGRLFEKRL